MNRRRFLATLIGLPMTTTYHSPIVAGENNQPATINTRLAALDAGIVEVDARVDTIIADGDSLAEVVDTRNGYTVLNDRIDDLEMTTKLLKVDPAFTGLSGAKRFTTIAAAMTAATAGCTIEVAAGTYTENVTFSQANITLRGSGQPYFDGTDLIGGTIIKGLINCATKIGARVSDLGVDIRSTAQVDAITGGSSVVTSAHQTFERLTVIGKGSTSAPDYGHGILCSAGGGNTVSKCKFYLWYHGVALRCSNSIVSDCYFYNCLSDSVIVKGDTGSGDALNNTIANCIIDGSAASGFTRGGPVRVQNVHASTSARFTTVSNITAKNCGEACILIQQTAGICANVMVSNVISFNNGDAASRADFDVSAATDVHFTNCMSANRSAGYGFRTSAAGLRVRAQNCSSDFTGAGRSTGSFDYLDLGSGVGIDYSRFQSVTYDDATLTSTMRRSMHISGGGGAASGVAEPIMTLTWTGVPNTTTVAIDLLISHQSGSLSRIYHYQIAIVRPNSSTLVGAMEAIGTAGFSSGGSGNSLVVALDLATANTAKITIAGSGGAASYGWEARITSIDVGSWTVANNSTA